MSAHEAPLTVLNAVHAGAHRYAEVSPVPIQIAVESFALGRLKDLAGLRDGSRFNGAIIANTGLDDDAFLVGHVLPMPVVLFTRHVENRNCINATNTDSGRLAAEHLIKRGCRRLGVLSCAIVTQARDERRRGFIAAVSAAGLPPPLEIVSLTFNERGGCEAMTAFLESGQACDGLFVILDYMAFGAMHALRRSGRRVPADVAVIGHDDMDMASYVEPPLTTIHMPLAEMAEDAAATLVRILAGELAEPVQRTYQTHLVVRESA